ncbi:MAG: hypothetical protein E7133_07825 [Rikenellaceae bacterium]|nr:hypothetical protein [Rikenellaceae bacterium]
MQSARAASTEHSTKVTITPAWMSNYGWQWMIISRYFYDVFAGERPRKEMNIGDALTPYGS